MEGLHHNQVVGQVAESLIYASNFLARISRRPLGTFQVGNVQRVGLYVARCGLDLEGEIEETLRVAYQRQD